ncbi:MAG: single-stranded DNA-binding protein, partial [Candidatus Levyibacteriota bacterium]
MARSLNRVQLIGNLTRDPELRYTPQGTAVSTFGLATNRNWTTDSGEKKEDVEFHKIVAWNKLGELCSQLLSKGRKVYVEGRISNRSWTGQDGVQRNTTEIVIEDMIILDNKRTEGAGAEEGSEPHMAEPAQEAAEEVKPAPKAEKKEAKENPSTSSGQGI